MSVRDEVVEIFAEAAKLGTRRRFGMEFGFVILRRNPRLVSEPVEPVGVSRSTCDRCGVAVERRAGNPRAIHLGGGCGAGWVAP